MLEKILNKIKQPIKRIARKALPYMLAAALFIPFATACGNHKKKVIPINNSPIFITNTLPNAKENTPYSALVTASDPESDPITYSITGGTADAFLAINPNTGELTNDTLITDVESGTTHTLNVKATDDKGNSSEKALLLYVINTENVSGNVKDITNSSNLQGMQVKIGSTSILTDVNGNYVFIGVEDGNHQTEINDNTGTETNYFTHKVGTLVVSKQKNLEGKLSGINFKLIPTSFEAGDNKQKVLDHIYLCIRTQYDAEKDIKKWGIRPIFRIYKREFSTGNPVPQEKIDLVRDIILNELYKVDPLFTNPTITEIDGTRPVGPIVDGYVDVHWNDSISGARGANDNNTNNSDITGGYVWFKTTVGRNVHISELTASIIGKGESNLYLSVLNDNGGTPQEPENYTAVDFKLWEILKNRPKGNKDLDSAHNHDVNPSSYIANP